MIFWYISYTIYTYSAIGRHFNINYHVFITCNVVTCKTEFNHRVGEYVRQCEVWPIIQNQNLKLAIKSKNWNTHHNPKIFFIIIGTGIIIPVLLGCLLIWLFKSIIYWFYIYNVNCVANFINYILTNVFLLQYLNTLNLDNKSINTSFWYGSIQTVPHNP